MEYSEFENDFEDIKEEEQPHRMPILSSITHGGRSPQNESRYQSEENYSNQGGRSRVKFETPYRSNNPNDALSLNDIKMDLSETSSRKDAGMANNSNGRNATIKSKSKLNNLSKMYG